MINKTKLYILPMKVLCNANCTWCVSKTNNKSTVPEKMVLNDEFFKNFTPYIDALKSLNLQKLEFTGGGEPFINPHLQEIITTISNIFPKTYKKLYSNGFLLKPIHGVDELNISRSHWHSDLNKLVYRSPLQNDLKDVIEFFRPQVKTLRTCTVLQKGLIDTELKALEMIEKFPLVDTFIFRPMIPETLNHDHLKVDFMINHPKAQKDVIDCTCHKALVLAPNGKIYYDFNLTEMAEAKDICG